MAARKKTKKKTTRKKTSQGESRQKASNLGKDLEKRNERMAGVTVDMICDTANAVYRDIQKKNKPDLYFPVRSLKNVSYSQKKGYFEIGKQKKTRTLTVNTVKSFAQTLRMMGLSKELVESNDFATKRDAYYQSKNWEDARFDEQTESDAVMDDIEALFSIRHISREQLRFIPDEHGGAVAGRLVVLDPDRETGEIERIDCTRFGSGAYSIPSSVEQLSFETDAKFILAIETGGIFQRLQSHKFWQTHDCILVSMAGVPTRATRRFIRKLSDEGNLKVYAFVDCDPYGISNIYRTLKVGSGNAAHLSQFFCVPQASFLGVTPHTEPLGARAVQRQKPHGKPKAFKPSPAPIFHAATPEEYWTMLYVRKAKVEAYRDAAERLKKGETDVRFPLGCFPPPLPYVESRGPP